MLYLRTKRRNSPRAAVTAHYRRLRAIPFYDPLIAPGHSKPFIKTFAIVVTDSRGDLPLKNLGYRVRKHPKFHTFPAEPSQDRDIKPPKIDSFRDAVSHIAQKKVAQVTCDARGRAAARPPQV